MDMESPTAAYSKLTRPFLYRYVMARPATRYLERSRPGAVDDLGSVAKCRHPHCQPGRSEGLRRRASAISRASRSSPIAEASAACMRGPLDGGGASPRDPRPHTRREAV